MTQNRTSTRRHASAGKRSTGITRAQKLGLEVDEATSKRLGRIRQRDTTPEQVVRKLLAASGLRFRKENRDLPGSPDVANRRARWAIFVHGCFWHAHRGCPKATVPKRNKAFWEAKFAANRARDARAIQELRRLGYSVLVIWECETRRPDELDTWLKCRFAQIRGKRDS
jgi:DNA mismatch endonuclease (patch repair protein)